MWRRALCLYCIILQCNDIAFAQITAKKFQINFLNEVANFVEHTAQRYTQEYLQQLQEQTDSPPSQQDPITTAADPTLDLASQLRHISDILDWPPTKQAPNDSERFYALRNLYFLGNFTQELNKRREQSVRELRKLRVRRLCMQFMERPQMEKQPTSNKPLQPTNPKISLENPGQRLNLTDFGRRVYDRIKQESADLIDDYLGTVRKILDEVIVAKTTPTQPHKALEKLRSEADHILNITDFYKKRQRLYDYLEHNFTADFTEVRTSETADEDLELITEKLAENDLTLFFYFLRCNFEFLEHLQEQWALELTQTVARSPDDDEVMQLLRNIHERYEAFKVQSEETEKYEAYIQTVKELVALSEQSSEKVHLYELLHNASMNVGGSTLRMIDDECRGSQESKDV